MVGSRLRLFEDCSCREVDELNRQARWFRTIKFSTKFREIFKKLMNMINRHL